MEKNSELKSMKKRNPHSRTSASNSINESEKKNYTDEPNEKDIKIDNQIVGTTTKQYAQTINFAELQNLMMQNVNKKTNKTYTQYTKERLVQYLSNPNANVDNLRDVSQYVYTISPQYKTLVNYCANMLLYSYNVTYVSQDWAKIPKLKDFIQKYQEVCKRIDNMNLEGLGLNIIATTLRDGIYVGFTYDDGKSFYCNALDPKYCKISALTEKNTYLVKFDASFFDKGNNKEFIYGVDNDENSKNGLWDSVFLDGYESYKLDPNLRWFELPVERTICIICGDDVISPLPFWMPVLQDLLDILDYRDLIRSKTELENYVLLISKIPMLKDTDTINDFAVDLGLVQATNNMIAEVSPSLVAACYSPCDVDKIEFGNKNQVQDNNIYTDAIKGLFDAVGISQMLFSGDKSGSVGLRHSIRVDEAMMFDYLKRLEVNIQRYIKLNISEEFIFKFHRVTVFSQDEYITSLTNMASLGIPCKTDLATVLKTPYEMMNSTYMENALGLDTLWTPLATSYTQSSKESGGQKKKDTEITDEGADSRDSGKNEGTKAKG